MDLDRHKLEEEREWRAENYRRAMETTVGSIVHAIQNDTKRALEHEIVYDDDMRLEYTFADQASEVQHAILQAVNNAQFRALTAAAADLHAVAMALHTLDKLQASLPADMRAALAERENAALLERIEEKENRIKELDARDADGCVAAVPEGGRAVGFHRCSRRGRQTVVIDTRPGQRGKVVPAGTAHSAEVLVCATHAKDAARGHVHVYKPDDWTAGQQIAWRKKEKLTIARMRARLDAAIEQAAPQKEIEA